MSYSKRNFAAGRRTPPGSRRGVAGLLNWVKAAHPTAYAKLQSSRPDLVSAGAQLDGLGDASATVTKVTDTASQIANAILPFIQLDTQRKLLKIQVQRAAQGLPPLEMGNVSLPAQRLEFDAGSSISTGGKYLLFGALGIGALYLLTRRR